MSLRLITSTAKKEVPSIASLWTNHPVPPPKDPKKILSIVKKADMTKAEVVMEKIATSPMRIINAVTKRIGTYSPGLESKLETGKTIAMGLADKKTTKQLTKNLSLAPLGPSAPSEHDLARLMVNSVQSNVPNPNKLHPEVAGYFKRQVNTLDKNLNVGEIVGMIGKQNRINAVQAASSSHRFDLATEAGKRMAPEPTRIKALQGKMMSSVLDRANNIITQLRQTK